MAKGDLPLNEAAAAMGEYLRERRGEISIVRASLELKVNKNTLVAYEKGRALPDISFLALHAYHYKSEFSKLLVMRMEADTEEEVRSMIGEARLLSPDILDQPTGHLAFGLRVELLADIIHAVEIEQKHWASQQFAPQRKARFIASLYALLYKLGPVDMKALQQHISFWRPKWFKVG